jgi:SAM-dependent methyltransferase
MEDPEPTDRLLANEWQSRYFDGAVDLFDQEQPPHILRNLQEIVDAAAIREGEVVLDAGAGVGVLVPLIAARRPGRIVACEISGQMLSRLKARHPQVEAHLEDVGLLPLAEGSIDVLFMNAVFSNLSDKPGALANCARMLRLDGRLVVSHPEGRGFVERLREVLPFPLDPLPTFPQLRRLLAPFPLKLVRYIDRDSQYIALIRRVKDRA